MCIFVNASCIYAGDIDNQINNNQVAIDINGLNDEESEDLTTALDGDEDNCISDIDAKSDDSQYHKHHENNTDCKKTESHKLLHENLPIDEEIVGYCGNCQGVDLQKDNVDKKEALPDSIDINEDIQIGNSEKTIMNQMENILTSGSTLNNQKSAKSTDLHEMARSIDSKLSKEEFCFCKKGHCNHNLNTDIHKCEKIIAAGNINNRAVFEHINHNAQVSNSQECMVFFICSDEEEFINPRNRNLKNILSIYCNENSDDEDDLKGCGTILGMNASYLAINFTDFDYDGLELTLNFDELNIKDYNLEYYIFTNPYIIINDINVEFPDTNVSNHCFDIHKAKQTIAPTMNHNHSPFDDLITHDNYDIRDYALDTTIFYDTASAMEVCALKITASKISNPTGTPYNYPEIL